VTVPWPPVSLYGLLDAAVIGVEPVSALTVKPPPVPLFTFQVEACRGRLRRAIDVLHVLRTPVRAECR
jgi:hypothetical protein